MLMNQWKCFGQALFILLSRGYMCGRGQVIFPNRMGTASHSHLCALTTMHTSAGQQVYKDLGITLKPSRFQAVPQWVTFGLDWLPFNFSCSEAALMACTQWVNLTDNDFTISAIHWAENKVDADIEAAMMNTGQSTRSSSYCSVVSHWSSLFISKLRSTWTLPVMILNGLCHVID